MMNNSSNKKHADVEKEGDVRVVSTVVGNDNGHGMVSEEEKAGLDWKGRPANPMKHGGMRAASFVLGLQSFEIMAIAAVGNNLITYVINEMHFELSNSANIVTNFVGTIFLLALLGGYLSDSFLGSFWTILIFGFLELSVLPQLKPPKCDMFSKTSPGTCVEAKGFKALIFFVALYLVALGSGCVKPNMISHGADQFDREANAQRLSSYFNVAYFAFSIGELVALTLLVWVQTHSGMDVGFGVSAAAMATGLVCLICGTLYYRNRRPQGSIFTPIAQVCICFCFTSKLSSLLLLVIFDGRKNACHWKVLVAAAMKRKQPLPSNPDHLHKGHPATVVGALPHTRMFRFLDKACIRTQVDTKSEESPWRLCSVTQVEQTKMLLSVLPIFACTIVFNTILAQLQTFSVQQGSAMDTRITPSFRIPPASLQAIPYAMLVFLVPLYDAFLVPFARRLTGHESGISPLRRIGFGLFLATFSMVSAALVERKRRDAAVGLGRILSIFWITPQYLIFGVSEMFTAVGLIEFFYKQSLGGMQKMQSFLTAVTYCSYSFGFYISSLLVSLVNRMTGSSWSGGGWLSDNDLNKDRLDLFYWLLAVLSFLNFLNYIFWARWVSRRHDNKATNSRLSANSSNHDRIAAAPPKNIIGDGSV